MQASSPDHFSSDIRSEASSTVNPVAEDEESVDNSSPECSISSYRPERRKQRRNPSVLVQWIEEHPFNPYPTKQEKQQLAAMSGMTLRQLNDWFANARRNIKKLGFDLWRKKRNGVPNHKITLPTNGSMPPSVPPNVVATDNVDRIPLQSSPYTGIPMPMYGPCPTGGGTIKSIPSQPPPTSYARFNASAGLFSGSGWFTANNYRPTVSAMTTPQCCSCSMCSPNFANGVTTVFSSPSSQPLTKPTTVPLTAIPWTSSTPSGSNNYPSQYSYMTEQKDDAWSSHGSPDSCPDLSLSVSIESLPPVVEFMPKQEMVSSSSCLSNSDGISS